ncbi:MAG: helix-turn-helix transcriptional regulator [Candidatus Omnitrophota bacterium]
MRGIGAMKYDILLASRNKNLTNNFRKYVVDKNIRFGILGKPITLNKILKRKGPQLEVLILDMQVPETELERIIFYVKRYKINIPVLLLVLDHLHPTKEAKEILRNLSVYGFIQAPKNKEEAIETISELNELLELDMDKRFEKIDYIQEEKVFSCTFRNGKVYFLKRGDILEDDGSKIKNTVIDKDFYFFTVYLNSGKEYSIPWDFVLSKCEKNYEFYKDKTIDRITPEEIGNRIKKIRKANKLTQNELSAKTNIDRPNIARIEAGRHYPALETLEKISEALEISVAELVSR